jgi:hypothetical protein
MVTPVNAYLCPGCDRLYRDHHDAQECCEPEQVKAWECGNLDCEEEEEGIHESEAGAVECAGGGVTVETMCTCGCPRKWHDVNGMVIGCYSPGCFDCREFEAA